MDVTTFAGLDSISRTHAWRSDDAHNYASFSILLDIFWSTDNYEMRKLVSRMDT